MTYCTRKDRTAFSINSVSPSCIFLEKKTVISCITILSCLRQKPLIIISFRVRTTTNMSLNYGCKKILSHSLFSNRNHCRTCIFSLQCLQPRSVTIGGSRRMCNSFRLRVYHTETRYFQEMTISANTVPCVTEISVCTGREVDGKEC